MPVRWLCADSERWLAENKDVGAVFASLPDEKEMPLSPEAWQEWFVGMIEACIAAASAEAPAIFYQTDRKANGGLRSKAELIFTAAQRAGARLLWHKIVLRRDVGGVDLYRPTYCHLIAVSAKGRSGQATPDVIEGGASVYENGTRINAAILAVKFAKLSSSNLVDPFCGRGTVPAIASHYGMNALGIDNDPRQIEAAARLKVNTL